MLQKLTILLLCTCGLLLLQQCRKQVEFTGGTPLVMNAPGFPEPVQFRNGGLIAERVELGRRLFYDGRLSADGSISCASCHQQIAAFGTYDHDLSHGLHGQHSNRNAPPLVNLLWATSFGWDGRYTSLEAMIEAHINSPVDMGSHTNHSTHALESVPGYGPLFTAAYGSAQVTKERLLNALAQFCASMVSAGSRYDSVQQGLTRFTATEQAGYVLFQNNCSSCHKEPLFTDYSFRNTGLPMTVLADAGRVTVTGNRTDSLKFRVPTLRNLYYSFPFMHDGRFVAFSQVWEHYRQPAATSIAIDPVLRNGILLNATQQQQLEAFLKTLSDRQLVTNPQLGPAN